MADLVYYGWFGWVARPMIAILHALHAVTGNYGLAIILLTVTVKALLYPLTLKSMQSMAGMRKLQPEIEKLKAKYGDDREGLSRAQMALFQQHKVNPAGGCLPMFLQFPFLIILYNIIRGLSNTNNGQAAPRYIPGKSSEHIPVA